MTNYIVIVSTVPCGLLAFIPEIMHSIQAIPVEIYIKILQATGSHLNVIWGNEIHRVN